MKTPILIAAAILSGAALTVFAADPPKKELTPQQQRMSDCSKASKGMKGEEHKKFMSDCLKKDSTVDVSQPAKSEPKDEPKVEPKPAGGKPSQQDKMKTCNADADKDKLKGDARKKFMSDCLKGTPTAEAPKEPKPEPKPVGGKPGTEEGKKPSQQEKMKSCNAQADKDKLKGDDRKKFMSDCLKNAA